MVLSALSVAPMVGMASAQVGSPADGAQGETFTFHHENVLGTSLQVTVRAEDAGAATRAEAAALGEFDRQAGLLSAWSPLSEFSRWERTRLEAVPVSAELMATLAAFDRWRERTGGALDASAEAASRLWARASGEGRVPTASEIAEVREAMGQAHWALDGAAGTATRLSGVPLALATFAKSRIASSAADAALAAGATGVMLNVGGDVVVRGALTQMVLVAHPERHAENEAPADFVLVKDAAVATSGGYRRGAHLFDPATGLPAVHMLSSTVVAPDAETAGALATALSVMPLDAGRRLADGMAGVSYLLVTAEGETLTSAKWQGSGRVRAAGFAVPPKAPVAGMWDPAYELTVDLTLPRVDDARYRRPYVAVWIEDAEHFPVRTLALWTQNPRWLPELKQWYRDDQIRNLAEGTDVSKTISSATRPAGKYTLKWDGKDNEGKPVKAGEYTVVMEASREHGGYQMERRAVSFTGKPAQVAVEAGKELGAVTLDYHRR